MKTLKFHLFLLTIFLLIFGCSKTHTMSDVHVDFASNDLKGLVIKNLSILEANGRWTDGKEVLFTFPNQLPSDFTLILQANDAFNLNAGKAFKVIVGNTQEDFVIESKKDTVFMHKYKNTEPGVKTISIIVPSPSSPAEMGSGKDIRKLGAVLRSLEIRSSNL